MKNRRMATFGLLALLCAAPLALADTPPTDPSLTMEDKIMLSAPPRFWLSWWQSWFG